MLPIKTLIIIFIPIEKSIIFVRIVSVKIVVVTRRLIIILPPKTSSCVIP